MAAASDGRVPKQQRGIGSLDTAGLILRALTNAAGPMKLRDLAAAVGIAPSQLHPYLVSLRGISLVEQTEDALYGLGPFALELGLSRLRSQDAYPEAVRRLDTLVEATDLMVALSVWGIHGVTIVYVRESPSRIHTYVRPGNIFALSTTATGRLFAAFHRSAQNEAVIRSEFERTRGALAETEENQFRERLAVIRAQGYETTVDLPIPGISAVAAPVFDHTGAMQLSVTAIGPTAITDVTPSGMTVHHLMTFTQALSRDLGFGGPVA